MFCHTLFACAAVMYSRHSTYDADGEHTPQKKCTRIVKLFCLKQNVRGSFTGVIVNPTLFARADEIKSGVLRTMSAVNDYGE